MEKEKKIIGTLVPLFALKSKKQKKSDYGTLESGFAFLKWLKETGQSAWQLLPLSETQLETGSRTKHVPSPYKGYGIGLSSRYLSSAFARRKPSLKEKERFMDAHKYWLKDYALFCALRDHYDTDDWRTWEAGLKKRNKETLLQWTEKLSTKIDFYITQQWQLHQSYIQFHKKAKELGIVLIGDLPYYLSIKSPLVWAYQACFHLGKKGEVEEVSGVPNVPGSHFGRQVWGHPLYNWQKRKEVIALWKIRLKYQSLFFDMLRFDHAKAFFTYGVIVPANESHDHYEKGPGAETFKALIRFGRKQGLRIFVEDSGDRVGELRTCLKELKTSGIKIYRFAIKKDGAVNERYSQLKNYTRDCVAYTTTHDTEPLVGYLQKVTAEQKQKLAEASEIKYDRDDKQFAKNIRRAFLDSPARTVIIPIQDWLLTTDRINIPGTEKEINDPNWHYKIKIPTEALPIIIDKK